MKGQTAIEYLLTYGWAFLFIIVVVMALYAMGAFSQKDLLKTTRPDMIDFPCSQLKLQLRNSSEFSLERIEILQIMTIKKCSP